MNQKKIFVLVLSGLLASCGSKENEQDLANFQKLVSQHSECNKFSDTQKKAIELAKNQASFFRFKPRFVCIGKPFREEHGIIDVEACKIDHDGLATCMFYMFSTTEEKITDEYRGK